MTNEEFDILTSKVLAGEASADELALLNSLLDQNPARRAEFDELRTAWKALREFSPVTRSLELPPASFPEYRMGELQSAVRKHFSGKRRRRLEETSFFQLLWAGLNARRVVAGIIATTLLVGGALLLVRDRSDRETLAYLVADKGRPEIIRAGNRLESTLAVAMQEGDEINLPSDSSARILAPGGSLSVEGPLRLSAAELDKRMEPARLSRPSRSENGRNVQNVLFGPLKKVVGAPVLAVMRDPQGIALYSPRGATRSLTPLVLWKTEPGKTYDLTISDEFDKTPPPWQLGGVVSPVEFGKVEAWRSRPLAKEGLYRIVVREAGNPLSACDHTFRTLEDANGTPTNTPAEKITRAYELLTAGSPCVGDALSELLSLPPEFADEPLVLRLKLAAFGQLGLHEEYDEAAAKLTLGFKQGSN